MDTMDNITAAEEQLVRQYVSSQRRDIPDNGFTEQVMRRVDIRITLWVRLINVATITGVAVMFYWLGGFNIIATEAESLWQSMTNWLAAQEAPTIMLHNPLYYLQPEKLSWLLYPIGFILITTYIANDCIIHNS